MEKSEIFPIITDYNANTVACCPQTYIEFSWFIFAWTDSYWDFKVCLVPFSCTSVWLS